MFTSWGSSMVALAGLILLTALAGASKVSADSGNHRGWIAVSGSAVPSNCAADDFALALSGDLEGCWTIFPESFTCEELNGFAWYTEAGREAFDGTLHGEPGSFVTTYTFEAAFAAGFCSTFDFHAELAGGCDHYVKGKSGSFTGVVGRITFVDIIPGIVTSGAILPGPDGATDFFYIGQLNRGGGQGQSP
jgi:hypothetical protein